jgi:hypothetical protein
LVLIGFYYWGYLWYWVGGVWGFIEVFLIRGLMRLDEVLIMNIPNVNKCNVLHVREF